MGPIDPRDRYIMTSGGGLAYLLLYAALPLLSLVVVLLDIWVVLL